MVLYCRAGFESECAAELLDRAAEHGVTGHCVAKAGAGYARFESYPPQAAADLSQTLTLDDLTFTRQWFAVLAWRNDLPVQDRITPLPECARQLPEPAHELVLEHTDTEAGKPMAGLARALAPRLRCKQPYHDREEVTV